MYASFVFLISTSPFFSFSFLPNLTFPVMPPRSYGVLIESATIGHLPILRKLDILAMILAY